jgi:hypothetical protein
LLPFFGTTAIVIAALTAPSAPPSSDVAEAAPARVPVVAAAPARRRRHQAEGVTVRPAGPSDQDAIEQQMQMRVLMPAASGDGGG